MIVLIILLSLVLISFIFAVALHGEGSALFFIIGLGILVFPIVSISNHTSSLAVIRQGKLMVDIRQEAIDEINRQLKNIKVTQTALMNGDSPVSSLINTKAKFIDQLAEEKIKIAEAKIDIEKRSLGLMYGIVKMFGRE